MRVDSMLTDGYGYGDSIRLAGPPGHAEKQRTSGSRHQPIVYPQTGYT